MVTAPRGPGARATSANRATGTTTDGLLPATVPGLTGVTAVAGGGLGTGYAITR